MRLVDVYEIDGHHKILWNLLDQRPADANISHRSMPSWEEHVAFVDSRPYAAWYFVVHDDAFAGAAYLTKADEVGIFLFPWARGKGWGRWAVKELLRAHPRKRYLANIAPGNGASVSMFERLGFSHIQNTYELRP